MANMTNDKSEAQPKDVWRKPEAEAGETPLRSHHSLQTRKPTGRYFLAVTMEQFRQHHGVVFTLFHVDALPEEAYVAVIPDPVLRTDAETRGIVKQTFSEGERAALKKWFASWPGLRFNEEEVYTVTEQQVGLRTSGGGVYDFTQHEKWPLPCRVLGYYDVLWADSGPCVSFREAINTVTQVLNEAINAVTQRLNEFH
jgi:hypothetical protein